MALERRTENGLTFLLFPPGMLSLYVDSLGGNQARPHTASEALHNSDGEAVLDGPMFRPIDPSEGYARYTSGTILYRHLDLTEGIDIASRHPSYGMTISVMPDGGTRTTHGSAVPPGARVAVQLYPELVVNGEVLGLQEGELKHRAALAVMRDGQMAFVVSPPMYMPEFAQRLVASGVLHAGYTDGGGSTSLATATGRYGSTENRRVLSWLVAKARHTVVLAKSNAVPIAMAVAVLGGLGLWYWQKTRRSGRRSNPTAVVLS